MKLPREMLNEITGIEIEYDYHTMSVLIVVEFENFHAFDSVYCPAVFSGNIKPTDAIPRIIKAFNSRPEQFRKPTRKVFR